MRLDSADSNKSAGSQLDMGKSQSSIKKEQKSVNDDGSISPTSPRVGDAALEKNLNIQLSFGSMA